MLSESEVIAQQGWDTDTLYDLATSFIAVNGLASAWVDYLNDIADEENAMADGNLPESIGDDGMIAVEDDEDDHSLRFDVKGIDY